MDEIYIIEFSKNALEIGAYPFHIQRLSTAVSSNRYLAGRDDVDWIPVYAGSKSRCEEVLPDVVSDMLTEDELESLPDPDSEAWKDAVS